MNAKTPQSPEDLLDELRTLVAEAEKIIADASPGKGEEAFADLRERLASARERIAGSCQDTKERVAAGMRATDETIREHPYQSLAIAAGIGVLVGVLLGRRSK